MGVGQTHLSVNWIILTKISRVFRNTKWSNREGWTQMDTYIYEGKKQYDISRTANKILKELLFFYWPRLSVLAHR